MDGRLAEPVAADHFETFEFSQDLPFGVLTLVGRHSWFVFALDPAPHARTGKVTPMQAARLRSRPARPRHGGYRSSFLRGLDLLFLLAGSGRPLRLACDGREQYLDAARSHPLRAQLQLEVHPNMVAWRNFIKGRSERRPDPTTPAMRLGLTQAPWSWRQLLARRLFPYRARLPRLWSKIYRRDWPTPVLPVSLQHRRHHAA